MLSLVSLLCIALAICLSWLELIYPVPGDEQGMHQPAAVQTDTAGQGSVLAKMYGINISRYQGDFIEGMDGLDSLSFLICKATEGFAYTDPDLYIKATPAKGAVINFTGECDFGAETSSFIRK